MKDLQPIKAIAENMLSLALELLQRIDSDEQEYKAMLERVKKMPRGMCCIFRA